MEKNCTSPTELIEHIRAHVSRYFPEWSALEVHVKLVDEKFHPHSKFYRFAISAGDEHKFVLAKVSIFGNGQNSQGRYDENRPRIAPLPNLDLQPLWQYEALAAIHQHIDSLKDHRFGTVRVLDFFPDQQAIIMEEVQALIFRQLFLKASRLQLSPGGVDIDSAFQNTGAWLHAYHGLAMQNYTDALLSRRNDFIRAVHKFVDYLSQKIGEKQYFKCVASMTVTQALNTLPKTLPVGLRHGDFALRNVLIGPNHRVTGIDASSKYQSAIYEDIAYFFISLQTVKIQVLSQGLAFGTKKLTGYKQEFINGYFGEELVPQRQIRLFEILVLLEKWCDKVAYLDNKLAGKSIVIRTLAFKFMNRFFRRTIAGIFKDIEKLPTG